MAQSTATQTKNLAEFLAIDKKQVEMPGGNHPK